VAIGTSVSLPAVHPFVGADLTAALAERASYWGDSTYLVWEPPEGERSTWTYSTFAAEVDQVAAGLQARGVRSGNPVVLMLDNSPAFLLCWVACARLGAVAIDLNTRYVTDEVRHALSITGVVGVVTHAGLPWVVTTDEGTGTCPDLIAANPPTWVTPLDTMT
jgi:crotonobetaine/carnitine-CoA ligase